MKDFVDSFFSLEREETGQDKVMPLKEAVERFVRPGMCIHVAFPTYHRANATVREIIRQYWGQKPAFTFLCVGFGVQNFGHVLVHGRLVQKVISTFFADAYPTPGPNPVFQKAFRQGDVRFEHWSIFSYACRLLVGAMGIGFMPVKSLIGSTMAEENTDAFQIIEDPFEPGKRRGVVRAMNPDISLVHGLAADRQGNTILAPPYCEDINGAFASREGVLVSVEELVSTEFIRKYSHMVKIPSHMVRSVSVVPLGAHPLGMSSAGVPEIEVYADDYDFLEEARKACRDETRLEEWIEQWVLGCPDQETYTKRLGERRISHLKGKTAPDSWRLEIEALEKAERGPEHTVSEAMIVGMSRLIVEKVLANEYTTILAGIGQANLAAWLARYELRDRGCAAHLLAEIGMLGYAPRPTDPFIFNHGNVPTATMLTDSFKALGIMVAGETNRCIGALGAAFVDKRGNLNSTLGDGGNLISGSGGANDTASGSREVVVSVFHSRDRLVERVRYITSPGERVSTLVTSLGIFEKLRNEDDFTLTRLLPSRGTASVSEAVQKVREKTGWEVKVGEDIQFMEPPTAVELLTLRLFDPNRHFTG
jgi:acyl CoA:acetate/3-ketoacid CoA transferase alpha subunit/acyl CoA:acetate/3-ketoacid CoA transferase beta subunit